MEGDNDTASVLLPDAVHAADELQQVVATVRARFANGDGWIVDQLVRERTRELLQYFLGCCAFAQPLASTLELLSLHALGTLPERTHQVLRFANPSFAEEPVRTFENHDFCRFRSATTTREMCIDDLGEIVDRIQIHVAQHPDLGLDVAWHRDVHHQHRPVLAAANRGFDGTFAEQRKRAAGGRNHDVESVQLMRYLGELQRPAAY